MGFTARVSLPTYDALTDTNLDHFSLYADIDNILIKRKLSDQTTIADGNPTILTVAHNLGYIPFFMVYYFDEVNSVWKILNNQYNPFSVPDAICAVDTTNLYIYNFGGHGSGHIQVAYDIFYDNMNDNTAPLITESSEVFKVARPGVNALVSKNPNDYIMHSDLNNFKILGSGLQSIDCNGLTTITIPHGVNVQAPFKYFLFIKSPFDSKTLISGGTAHGRTYDDGSDFFTSSMDATNIYITKTQSNFSEIFKFVYIIYGSGKNNTIEDVGQILAVAATGHDVLTETNPDNFNFHSDFATLKYFMSGTYSMTVSSETIIPIAHNLGYVPFFVGFVNDLAGIISNSYAIMPYYWGRSSVGSPNQDIGAFMYADDTNIYLKAFYEPNAVGTTKTFNFYYKIFKNNLNL